MSQTRRRSSWFLRTPSPDAVARVFCLPYSGCGASMYHRWPRFARGVELCAVQLPGRENRLREPTFTTFEAVAEALAPALDAHLDKPYAFFGHCSSALIGYQTVLLLAELGYPTPARLFVSSQVAPHQGPYGRFLWLTKDELAAEVRGLLRGLGVADREDLMSLTLDVLVADIAAHKAYGAVPPVRVPCPITSIGWDADVEVPPELMTGWSDVGDTVFRLLAGSHYGFVAGSAELIDVLASDLLAELPGVR